MGQYKQVGARLQDYHKIEAFNSVDEMYSTICVEWAVANSILV